MTGPATRAATGPTTRPTTGPEVQMWPTVQLLVVDDSVDIASAELWDLGTTGVAEHPKGDGTTLLVAGFPSVAIARQAARLLDTEWGATVEVVEGAEWLDAWREHFTPLRVGRVVITPGWKSSPAVDPVMASVGAGDVLVPLDPGHAFGTGSHASTRLALEELHVHLHHGARLLDVGCGSGILSLAAIGLGADRVTAVDIETEAVRAATENAARLGMGNRIAISTTAVAELMETFEVVVANILAPVLIELAPVLRAVVRPGGSLVLSGLIESQEERVIAAYDGFSLAARRTDSPWVCLALRAPAAG